MSEPQSRFCRSLVLRLSFLRLLLPSADRLSLSTEKLGDLETETIKEFFYAVSYSAAMNIHIKMISGENSHHMIEAIFKAFAKALDMATAYDERIRDVLSTKGSL